MSELTADGAEAVVLVLACSVGLSAGIRGCLVFTCLEHDLLLLLMSLAVAALLVLVGLSVGLWVAAGAALLSDLDEVLGVADVECLIHGFDPCAVFALGLVLSVLELVDCQVRQAHGEVSGE